MRRVPLWKWWAGLVVLISLPWVGFAPAPHWDRVHWIPFTDPADKPKDLLANIALFVPFGISFARGRPGARRYMQSASAAAAVSLVAETTQLFGTVRHPSATDLLAALVGSCIGAAWMAWVEHERA